MSIAPTSKHTPLDPDAARVAQSVQRVFAAGFTLTPEGLFNNGMLTEPIDLKTASALVDLNAVPARKPAAAPASAFHLLLGAWHQFASGTNGTIVVASVVALLSFVVMNPWPSMSPEQVQWTRYVYAGVMTLLFGREGSKAIAGARRAAAPADELPLSPAVAALLKSVPPPAVLVTSESVVDAKSPPT